MELEIVFDLADPNGELLVPEQLKSRGLHVEDEPGSDVQPAFKTLIYSSPNGGGLGLPLYQRVTTDIANCAPGQTRKVHFPRAILNRLFLRGLQYEPQKFDENSTERMVLSVSISFHTFEGDRCSTQFRFHVFPFHLGLNSQLSVCGHFWELPMYPKNQEPRVT